MPKPSDASTRYPAPRECETHVPSDGPPVDEHGRPMGTYTPREPYGVASAPLTLPLACPYCGRAIAIEYVAQRDASVSCPCPYEDCRKLSKIAGIARLVSVRADFSH